MQLTLIGWHSILYAWVQFKELFNSHLKLWLFVTVPVGFRVSTMKPKLAVPAKLRQPTGQRISNVRKQHFFFQFCQSYSYVNRKVWYHQIWIPNNLGFMVLILSPKYVLTLANDNKRKRKFPANVIMTTKFSYKILNPDHYELLLESQKCTARKKQNNKSILTFKVECAVDYLTRKTRFNISVTFCCISRQSVICNSR